MSGKLGHLKPELLWKHFENLCAIPRPSKHEAKVIEYVKNFGQQQKLVTTVDEVGNVILKKPATKGMEKRKIVVLQSHLDMVPQKNSQTQHDFVTDSIKPFISGEYVKADGTTLGADNGIGVAAMLALLESKEIPHGPLEALFTVDEEAGMGGVFGLKKGLLNAEIMLNLDSETEGEIFIGCAGGINTTAKGTYQELPLPAGYSLYDIKVTGAKGGHSGIEINLKRANSNKLMGRLLSLALEKFDLRLVSFDGGNLRNAIPRECFSTVAVHESNKNSWEKIVTEFQKTVSTEHRLSDPDIKISTQIKVGQEKSMDSEVTKRFVQTVLACFHGVKNMIVDMPEVTETSTNLAIVKALKGEIDIRTLQRSSYESHKMEMATVVRSCFELGGLQVSHDTSYPGWAPNTQSPSLKLAKELFFQMTGKEAKVMATHGGLECGLITSVYPQLDAISFGPTIHGAHSPDERVEIQSVERFWHYLTELLQKIPLS